MSETKALSDSIGSFGASILNYADKVNNIQLSLSDINSKLNMSNQQVNTLQSSLTDLTNKVNMQTSQVNISNSCPNVYSSCINSVVSLNIIGKSGKVYTGSGFFIQSQKTIKPSIETFAYILTAGHVIIDPETNQICPNIFLITSDGNSTKASSTNLLVLGVDKIADIALLRVSLSVLKINFTPLTIANSRTQLSIGESVSIIGYPLAFDIQSITRGIVRDNKYQDSNIPESVMTDASTFGGNSGGPILKDDNRVVGILSWGLNPDNNSTGLDSMNGGIASYLFTPIIKYFTDNFNEISKIPVSFPKGYLAITYEVVSPMYPLYYPTLKVEGYRVTGFDTSTIPGSITPVYSKDFNLNDIITEVNGIRVGMMNCQFSIMTEIHLGMAGKTINVKYLPYVSGTYGKEISKNIILKSFNTSKDVFLTNCLRKCMKRTF